MKVRVLISSSFLILLCIMIDVSISIRSFNLFPFQKTTIGNVSSSAVSVKSADTGDRIGSTVRRLSSSLSSYWPSLLTRKYQSLLPFQRTATTPVFYISNGRGHPYLQDDMQSQSPDQKITTYFMSYDDANAFLTEMSQSNPRQHVNDFYIMTMPLEKVLSTIQSKKQSRKITRYEIDSLHKIQVGWFPIILFLF
jgi:hypothetical protein